MRNSGWRLPWGFCGVPFSNLLISLAITASLSASGCRSSSAKDAADSPPQAPLLEDLPLQKTVTQYGITWTFDKPTRVGRFVNWDYYVVGPVTVVAIHPKPLYGLEIPESELDERETTRITPDQRLRNGFMLNPPARNEVSYDSGIRVWYEPKLTARLPVPMKPGDTLVSSISLKKSEKAKFVYHSGGTRTEGDNCPLKVAAVLTCVSKPQPPDAFRPAYCDREQTIYLARNLRRDRLPAFSCPPKAPDPIQFAEVFQKVWLNTCFYGFEQPMENMPHYGQRVCQAVGNAGLLLCLSFWPKQKEPLLINFVQVGIDYWGLVKSGHPGWQGWGGHGSGRKFPILFAGYMLGDDQMAHPNKSYPDCNFGEDNQTRYDNCWTGAKVVFAGHSGIQNSGKIERPQWGPYEHLHPSQWDKNGAKNWQSESYRRANTSSAWVAQALAMHLLKLEPYWNHDAFFDYVDRWMYEDDRVARHIINQYFPNNSLTNAKDDWFHQGYAGEPWVKQAWDMHRTDPSLPPIDGWKKPKKNPVPHP